MFSIQKTDDYIEKKSGKKSITDYKKMELIFEYINSVQGEPKLLLHSCCAPCSSHVISVLDEYFYITILYYNPNIEPVEEYNKRKEEEKRFLNVFPTRHKIDMLDCDYDNDKFHEMARGMEECKEGGARCYKCYEQRLEKTAQTAVQNGYDFFCTTLSVSPYKNSKWINEIGLRLGKKYDINYLISDFKKKNGYKHSIELSKEYGLYRQDYCGCVYSKK